MNVKNAETLYYLTVMSHWIVFALMVLSVPYLILLSPWYVACPGVAFVIRTAFSPALCPLSQLECYYARLAGFKEHKYFVKGHILPVYRAILGRIV